jgi:hypothetical protein
MIEELFAKLSTCQTELKTLAPDLQCHISMKATLCAGGASSVIWTISGGFEVESSSWERALASAKTALDERARAREIRRSMIAALRTMYVDDLKAFKLALRSIVADIDSGNDFFVFNHIGPDARDPR